MATNSTQQNTVQPTAIPKQEVPPLAPGAISPGQSAYMNSQQELATQRALTGKTGGKTRGKRRRGGAAAIVVPNPPPGPTATASQPNYTSLTALAQQQQQQATFDSAKTPAQTAALQAQNNQMYKGGSRRYSRRRYKMGGSWPKWGCLSGGKTRRYKNQRNKSKKNKQSRRRVRKINR
jgi:hypothetical protein